HTATPPLARPRASFRPGHGPQPLRRPRVPAAHQFVELLLQGAGYGTSLAIADDAKINFAQTNDFRRRAAHKDFVGDIKLIAREGFLDHGVAKTPSQCDQAVASDAFQNPRPRRGVDNLISV